MVNNLLIKQFCDKGREKLLPENMDLVMLRDLAVRLARYKDFVTTKHERSTLEIFVKYWTGCILKMQTSKLMNKFIDNKHCEYEIVFFGMPELEYLVHQELIFRTIGHRTSEQHLRGMFELERIKLSSPDFLRAFLFNIGLGLTAQADLSTVMKFRSDFLGRRIHTH
jgi:hypothetical protein